MTDNGFKEDLAEYGTPNWVAHVTDSIRKLKEESLLSDRQAEVYSMRKAGLYNNNIADVLGITEQTVSEYYGDAEEKFAAAERTVELREELEPEPRPHEAE